MKRRQALEALEAYYSSFDEPLVKKPAAQVLEFFGAMLGGAAAVYFFALLISSRPSWQIDIRPVQASGTMAAVAPKEGSSFRAERKTWSV